MAKTPEQFSQYSEEEALEEASRMQKKVKSGSAKDFNEAEALVNQENDINGSLESRKLKLEGENNDAEKEKIVKGHHFDNVHGDLKNFYGFVEHEGIRYNIQATISENGSIFSGEKYIGGESQKEMPVDATKDNEKLKEVRIPQAVRVALEEVMDEASDEAQKMRSEYISEYDGSLEDYQTAEEIHPEGELDEPRVRFYNLLDKLTIPDYTS